MTTNIIAQSLSTMKSADNYKEFEKGYFTNKPEMQGYILELKGYRAKVFVVVNTNMKSPYPNNYYADQGFHFIVYNSPTLEEFIDQLPDIASDIIKILNDVKNTGTETGKKLPYGYFEDEEGEIKVNPQEASEVRKIYKDYINNRSIRKVARTFKEDYSFIHDILHDVRYSKMPIKIIPMMDMKKVNLIIQQNTKNKYRKNKLRRVI